MRHFTNVPTPNKKKKQSRHTKIEPINLCASGDVLYCKFSQLDVDWKPVDMCKHRLKVKVHVKYEENTVLSTSEISAKG